MFCQPANTNAAEALIQPVRSTERLASCRKTGISDTCLRSRSLSNFLSEPRGVWDGNLMRSAVCGQSVLNVGKPLVRKADSPDSVCLVLPLHFPTGRFWLRGRLQHLPLCGIRKRPLSLLHTTALP